MNTGKDVVLCFIVAEEIKDFHFIIECFPVNVKKFRRFSFVVIHLLQHFYYGFLLSLLSSIFYTCCVE